MSDQLTNPPKTSLLVDIVDDHGGCELEELTLDLRSTWNHAIEEVWRRLDLALWELIQPPWAVLKTVSKNKLKGVLADPVFRKKVDDQLQAKRRAAGTSVLFQQKHSQSLLKYVVGFIKQNPEFADLLDRENAEP